MEKDTTGEASSGTTHDIPKRYVIRSRDAERDLICTESPSMKVCLERGFSVTGPAARKAPPGSIYLDGAAQEGPFLDPERHVYNLDHHQGCIRAFTLATCEQAIVLVRKGLDLQGRDWTIYANEPDLDTILALWVLLNHTRVNDADGEVRSRIIPIIRLQGAIDAHGLEGQELCGFSSEQQDEIYSEIERLRAREVDLKKDGEWQQIDFLEYAAEALWTVDTLVYSSEHFEQDLEVEELARADIGENGLAIVCRSSAGIFEIEKYLRRVHGKRLGVIVLQKDPRSYTLRQLNAFLPVTLEGVYKYLNLLDDSAGHRRSGNRWGGSGDIGGSPRATGTDLTPSQIAEAFAHAFHKSSALERLGSIATVIAVSAAVILGPIIAVYVLSDKAGSRAPLAVDVSQRIGIFTSVFCFLSVLFFLLASFKIRKLYGLRMPTVWNWLLFLPIAFIGALLSGAWISAGVVNRSTVIGSAQDLLVVLALPAAAEILFRGFVHGTLSCYYHPDIVGARWYVSFPTITSTLLYAIWSSIPFLPFYSLTPELRFVGATVFGYASSAAREQSESIVPPLIFHWCSLLLVVLLRDSFLVRGSGI